MPDPARPDAELARHILQRVGESGQPPERGIEHLNVGNEGLLSVLEREYLDPIARTGRGSSFKLVQAYYGGGKTHFLTVVRQLAWRRGMAAAVVGLSPQECPFDDAVRIYGAVARELTWPPADPAVLPARGIEHALRTAVETRLDEVGEDALLLWLERDFRRLPVDSTSYRRAVRAYARAVITDDPDVEEVAGAWLRGDSVGRDEARALGIRELLDRSNGFRFLRSLVQVLQHLGAPGMLLAFDELDRVLSLPSRRRRAVADNLRELIDLCGREALPGLLILYAVPPEFMREVVQEYPALQQRLEGPSTLSERSPQAAIIDLEHLDFSDQELLYRIGRRLLDLVEIARGVSLDPRVQEANLRGLAERLARQSFEVGHRRTFVKAAVEMLHDQAVEERLLSPDEVETLAGGEAAIHVLPGADTDFEEF